MKVILILGVFLTLSCRSTYAEDILAAGTYYYNAQITAYYGDYLTIKHRGGEAYVAWKDLGVGTQMSHSKERAAALTEQAKPKPATTFPPEVVSTRSLKVMIKVAGFPPTPMMMPIGTKFKVLSVAGLYLETKVSSFNFLVPLELTDYVNRNAPAQPSVSDAEQNRLGALPVAVSAF